jgi:predicted transcriptional regulator
MLRILEEKGYLKHFKQGNRYVYRATQSSDDAARSAMQYTVQSFYGGSAKRAMAALLDLGEQNWSDEDLTRFEQMIEKARREGN